MHRFITLSDATSYVNNNIITEKRTFEINNVQFLSVVFDAFRRYGFMAFISLLHVLKRSHK